MQDAWSHILRELDLLSTLTIRLVCKDWHTFFPGFYGTIANIHDLHPCLTIKQLFAVVAHRQLYWRQVPSFSESNRKQFSLRAISNRASNKQRDAFARMQAGDHKEYVMHVMLRAFVDEPEKTFSILDNIQLNTGKERFVNHLLETCVFFASDWSILADNELIRKLPDIIYLRKHSLLHKLYKTISTKSIEVQYQCFLALVREGVSPYYLDLFLENRLLQRRLSGRTYLSFLLKERNEYLLKRELEKGITIAIPTGWKRGVEISAKYRKKRKAAYHKR